MNTNLRDDVLSLFNNIKYQPKTLDELVSELACPKEELEVLLNELLDNNDIFKNKKVIYIWSMHIF